MCKLLGLRAKNSGFVRSLLGWLMLLYGATLQAQALVIHHDAGDSLFTETPKRIVALTWSQTEILLTLGVTPVGVATVSGYRKWQSNNPELPSSVVDLGHRGNPSLEQIAKLKPDLILGYNFRHHALLNRLQAIAPTVLYRQYPSGNDAEFRYFDQMLRITRDLGVLLNREQEAEAAILRMETSIAKARADIEAAGLNGESVLLGKFVGMGMGLRVYSDASMGADVASKLGLKNIWQFGLPGRDFSHIQLPQMISLENCHLIIFGDDNDEAEAMKSSAIWPHLAFVKSDQVYRVPNSWGFGGPLSAQLMAESIRNALVGRRLEEVEP